MRTIEAGIVLPPKARFLSRPARYKVMHGGRGGAKSWSIALALIARALREKTRILCAREMQLSIRDSVHRLLHEQIERLGLLEVFEVTHHEIRCKPTGSEFIFSGIKTNVTKIRSMEGIDVCWCEEAEAISEESWNVLIPTIRKEGSEIWVSFNPNLESDPTYQRFIAKPPPGAVVVEIGWEDNRWISGELLAEKDYLYSVDPDAAAHVWGGKTRQLSKAQVLYGKVAVEPFESAGWDGPYQGVDWGFADSPTTLVRLWVHDSELYVEREAYGVGVDIDETPALFDSVPDARKYVTRADSARPETISHMRKHGYPRMRAAYKGKGSVEDGVAHLRSYRRIVIHPRCTHAIDEARLWSYKRDRLTGDILPVLEDKHDHIWDAARYALEPLIRKRGGKVRAPDPDAGYVGREFDV
jgi:phage terminase large subunit